MRKFYNALYFVKLAEKSKIIPSMPSSSCENFNNGYRYTFKRKRLLISWSTNTFESFLIPFLTFLFKPKPRIPELFSLPLLKIEFYFKNFQISGLFIWFAIKSLFLNEFFLSSTMFRQHFRFKKIKNNNRTAIQFRIDYIF